MLGGIVGSIGNFKFWPSRVAAAASAFAAIVVVGALVCVSAFAAPPYEPNDSLLTGYGPLSNNTTYTATLETENDVDYYYFYVTTPSSAQLTFTLTNLGGGASSYSEVDGFVTDSHGNEITTIGYGVDAADYSTKSVTLGAGKYYVKIDNNESYGESYKFTTSGTEGAFGAYSTIQSYCATATVPVSTYQAQLAVAQANLKKAEARLRYVRNHRSSRRAKRRASAKVHHVRETISAEEESLRAAEAGQKPWCFIPQ